MIGYDHPSAINMTVNPMASQCSSQHESIPG